MQFGDRFVFNLKYVPVDFALLSSESSYDDTYSPTSEISIVDHIIFEVENDFNLPH